jgi:hypothetical protein
MVTWHSLTYRVLELLFVHGHFAKLGFKGREFVPLTEILENQCPSIFTILSYNVDDFCEFVHAI